MVVCLCCSSICLFICPSIHLFLCRPFSVCSSFPLYLCLFVSIAVSLSVSICLSLLLYVCLSVCLYRCMSVSLSFLKPFFLCYFCWLFSFGLFLAVTMFLCSVPECDEELGHLVAPAAARSHERCFVEAVSDIHREMLAEC